METLGSYNADNALMSLEAAATTARGGFACLFSTADEYETALISERRAQGRYSRTPDRRRCWPWMMFIGASMVVVGSVLVLN